MPIKVSGPLTIKDIADEFGGAEPHSLSEYYRGGTRVPNANINSNVPTSGAISVGDFYGASKVIYLTLDMYGGGGAGGRMVAHGERPRCLPSRSGAACCRSCRARSRRERSCRR